MTRFAVASLTSSVLATGLLLGDNFVSDYMKASTLLRKGEIEQAEKIYLELSNRDYRRPRNKDEALAGATDCALRRKNYDQARELAAKIQTKPMRDLWMMKVFRHQKKWDDVLRVSKDVDLGAWPDRLVFDARMCRGEANAARGNGKTAESDFIIARKSTLDHRQWIFAMRRLAELYRRQLNEPVKAGQLENEITKIQCEDAIDKARRLLKINKYETALHYLDKVDVDTIEAPEWKCRVFLAYGDVHAAFGEDAKALAAYKTAAKIVDAYRELIELSRKKVAEIETRNSDIKDLEE